MEDQKVGTVVETGIIEAWLRYPRCHQQPQAKPGTDASGDDRKITALVQQVVATAQGPAEQSTANDGQNTPHVHHCRIISNHGKAGHMPGTSRRSVPGG